MKTVIVGFVACCGGVIILGAAASYDVAAIGCLLIGGGYMMAVEAWR